MTVHQTLTPARAEMALKRQGIRLTDRQLTFLTAYLQGLTKADALKVAGYRENTSWSVFESASVRAAMACVIENFLIGDAAPAALRALYSITSDDKAAAGIRVQAANSLLDRAGFDSKRHDRQAAQTKDASQMTRDELQAEIDKLAREIDGRMIDVSPDSAPDSEPITSQDLDMYA